MAVNSVDNTDKQIGSVNLNPLGQGGDFIAFPVVGDVGYFVPAGQAASFSKVEIANFRSPANVIKYGISCFKHTRKGNGS